MFVEFENNIVNVKNIVCLYHESLEGKDSTLVMFIKIKNKPEEVRELRKEYKDPIEMVRDYYSIQRILFDRVYDNDTES